MSTLHRVQAGVPAGGQFAATQHAESDVTLDAGVDADTEHATPEAIAAELLTRADLAARRLAAHPHQDADILRARRDALREAASLVLSGKVEPPTPIVEYQGWQHTERRAELDAFNDVLQRPGTLASQVNGQRYFPNTDTVPSGHVAVQCGAVFDRVEVDGRVFHRRRDGVYPGTPYAMRFQANRPLSDEEIGQAAGLVGYAYRAEVRGEPMDEPDRDSPFSFTVYADTTKSRSDDLGVALESFEETLPAMFTEGSPVRKTDRSGPGTAGTRLVEGFNDPGLKFELYYDDVVNG